MAKGKRGPTPDSLSEPLEQQQPLATADPEIEQIIGEEHIVNVDDPENETTFIGDNLERLLDDAGYKCVEVGCKFHSNLLSEMEEHVNGTGHGGYKTEEKKAEQPELFSEPGTITRMVNVMLPTELLNEKRSRLAALYQIVLEIKDEKKRTDDSCNTRLKSMDEQMQAIARVLRTPYTYEKVACTWKIIDGENARGLYRIDTGELVEKRPLTMEDKIQEQEKAAEANATPPVPEEALEAAIPAAEEVPAETLA